MCLHWQTAYHTVHTDKTLCTLWIRLITPKNEWKTHKGVYEVNNQWCHDYSYMQLVLLICCLHVFNSLLANTAHVGKGHMSTDSNLLCLHSQGMYTPNQRLEPWNYGNLNLRQLNWGALQGLRMRFTLRYPVFTDLPNHQGWGNLVNHFNF